MAPKMWNTSFPPRLVVSIDWWTLRRPTVEAPDDERVARTEMVEHVRRVAAVVEGAAGLVHEGSVAAGGSELVELQLRVLVDR